MYPTATVPERIADGFMHFLGVFGAIFGTIYLLSINTLTAPLAVYGISLIAAFSASAVYNMVPYDAPRPLLRRIDHAMIYVLIAGTYTPLVVILDTTMGYIILTIVWLLALTGLTLKLFFWRKPGRFGPALYLVMGWLSIFLIWALIPVVSSTVVWLIAAGGLLYTAGVPIYAAKRLSFSTAIWHGFVVVASACFFAAIAVGATSLT
jgi:hemolysin III